MIFETCSSSDGMLSKQITFAFAAASLMARFAPSGRFEPTIYDDMRFIVEKNLMTFSCNSPVQFHQQNRIASWRTHFWTLKVPFPVPQRWAPCWMCRHLELLRMAMLVLRIEGRTNSTFPKLSRPFPFHSGGKLFHEIQLKTHSDRQRLTVMTDNASSVPNFIAPIESRMVPNAILNGFKVKGIEVSKSEVAYDGENSIVQSNICKVHSIIHNFQVEKFDTHNESHFEKISKKIYQLAKDFHVHTTK